MSALTDVALRNLIKARLLALPPRAFELLAGDLLPYMGLRDVSVTRYTSDGGIDAHGTLTLESSLINIPTGVQVKRYRANVPRPEIDRFIGALSGRYAHGIFITTAGYTREAIEKAAQGLPRVATVDGDQVSALMLRHRLGAAGSALDEEYFGQYEAQASARLSRVAEPAAPYTTTREATPEDDLISLRALSHELRVDPTVLRHWMEHGSLRGELAAAAARGGYFFRRDRVELIRAALHARARPADAEAWRQEFIEFARSRNLTKSYKPVMLKALLSLVDRNGEVPIAQLTAEFRAFYSARRQAGRPVEFGPPDPSDTTAVSDAQLRQLIVKNPLERFLIKGFLAYLADEGVVRFAPQLWAELRFHELIELRRSADEQLAHYYSRPR